MAKNILMITAPHGDERLGHRLYTYILNKHPDLIDYIDLVVGNPRAALKRVRYIDTDFNRSWLGGTEEGYEKYRAQAVSKYINDSTAKLVLDMHTTQVEADPSFIAYSLDGEAASFMAASRLERVVKMSSDLARTSLIGTHLNAVSIEISNSQINAELLESLSADIRNYLLGSTDYREKMLYPITGRIVKNQPERYEDEPGAEFINFRQSKKFGFYPILMGDNSYKTDPSKNYLGFYSDDELCVDILNLPEEIK